MRTSSVYESTSLVSANPRGQRRMSLTTRPLPRRWGGVCTGRSEQSVLSFIANRSSSFLIGSQDPGSGSHLGKTAQKRGGTSDSEGNRPPPPRGARGYAPDPIAEIEIKKDKKTEEIRKEIGG